jgi:hypothetical protein
MIKIHCENNFDNWHSYFSKRLYILANPGIGDLIISGNFAKYLNCGVVHVTGNNYRKKFGKEYCELIGVPYFFCDWHDKIMCDRVNHNNLLKIKQFDLLHANNYTKNTEIISSIYMMNHGFVKNKKNDKKIIFICPSGSLENAKYTRRSMCKDELQIIINLFKEKNCELYLVGIEKDIDSYGIYEGCTWINSGFLLKNGTEKEKINMNVFFQMVANSDLSITVPTSFHCVSNMLSVRTLTLHRLDLANNPIKKNDSYALFFANKNFYKKGSNLTMNETIDFINVFLQQT